MQSRISSEEDSLLKKPLAFAEVKRLAVDAKKPLSITVAKPHMDKGIALDPTSCPLALGGREVCPDLLAIHVLRTIVYVELLNGQCLRYAPSRTGEALILLYDLLKGNMTLKDGATFTVDLVPPRRNLSQAYLRSAERKVIEKASAKRRKGKKKRPYTSPENKFLHGVRHGGHKKVA
jgi:hypothetical protein